MTMILARSSATEPLPAKEIKLFGLLSCSEKAFRKMAYKICQKRRVPDRH